LTSFSLVNGDLLLVIGCQTKLNQLPITNRKSPNVLQIKQSCWGQSHGQIF